MHVDVGRHMNVCVKEREGECEFVCEQTFTDAFTGIKTS